MKKISQIRWTRYKESESGKESVGLFEKLCSSDCSMKDKYAIIKRFNPDYFKNLSNKEEKIQIEVLSYFNDFVKQEKKSITNPQSVDDYCGIYPQITFDLLADGNETSLYDIPQKKYKDILNSNICLSTILYSYYPKFYIPNLFVMQFIYLKRFAEKYEIVLPQIPNRSDYIERWFYYLDLCSVFHEFAVENSIDSPAEFCAFLYDYELPEIREEVYNESSTDMPEYPGQAWILVGNYGEGEKTMGHGFWQANQLTEKGDILLFYEKSPVKALNSVWIALQDGVVDPFFHYYSNTYIGNKISIPAEQAVRFEDFKSSEYFMNRDKKGNFVSKNFQDVSGWRVEYEDYQEIKRLLESKGFDTSVLPCLYEPTKIGDIIINDEKDVSQKLLIPLLEQMGWKKNIDFRGEVEFPAGRTETNYSSDKRPDFCLHIVEKNDDIEARVVFEVKKHMNTLKKVHENFVQGRSYAKWGNAQVLVLVDLRQILVYERATDNSFNESKPKKFSWIDMENPDKYAELKNILSKD